MLEATGDASFVEKAGDRFTRAGSRRQDSFDHDVASHSSIISSNHNPASATPDFFHFLVASTWIRFRRLIGQPMSALTSTIPLPRVTGRFLARRVPPRLLSSDEGLLDLIRIGRVAGGRIGSGSHCLDRKRAAFSGISHEKCRLPSNVRRPRNRGVGTNVPSSHQL